MARVIRARRDGPYRIAAEVYEAHRQVGEMLQKAREESCELRRSAQQEAEELRVRARASGWEQGKAEAAELLVRAAEVRDAALASAERETVKLATAAAERIVCRELLTSPETIADIVAPVLARARRARQVTIRVHPEDVALLQRAEPRLRAQAELACAISVQPDQSIARGGCVVVSNLGTLDARIEVQIAALAAALEGQT